MRTKPTKTFDALAMVRDIRDRIHGATKDMSTEERLRYFHEHGREMDTPSDRGTESHEAGTQA